MDPVPIDLNAAWNSVVAGFWSEGVSVILNSLALLFNLLVAAVFVKLLTDFWKYYLRPRPVSLNQLRPHKRR